MTIALSVIIIIIIQYLKNRKPKGKLILRHGCMARHRLAVGGEGFQKREVARSLLNKPVRGVPVASGWEGGGEYVTPTERKADMLAQVLDFNGV